MHQMLCAILCILRKSTTGIPAALHSGLLRLPCPVPPTAYFIRVQACTRKSDISATTETREWIKCQKCSGNGCRLTGASISPVGPAGNAGSANACVAHGKFAGRSWCGTCYRRLDASDA
ncbi:hypothetical protein GGI35DRAFT_430308 [Trichoderma velutinum]